jgi:hypothetical protein
MSYDSASVSITAIAVSNGVVKVSGPIQILTPGALIAIAQEAIDSLYGAYGVAYVGKRLDPATDSEIASFSILQVEDAQTALLNYVHEGQHEHEG